VGSALATGAAVTAALEAIGELEQTLTRRFQEGLAGLPHVRLWGISDPGRGRERTPTFALRANGHSPRESVEALGRRGIFAWDGNYFALAVMERLGLEEKGGAVRIGFCHYNTADEVDRVLLELSAMHLPG
jgi:selenocysteine lyase/cysteine desulfurase